MRTVLIAALLVAGCEPTFPDGHVVTEVRILAVRADPPEARIGDEVEIGVLAVAPDGTAPDVHAWQCAARGGMRQGCETFEDSIDLGDGPEGRLSIGEDWRARLDGAGGLPVQQVLTIVARRGPEIARAIKRVVVSDEPVGNENPVLAALLLGDEEESPGPDPHPAAPGEGLRMRAVVGEGSVERYRKLRLDGTTEDTEETLFLSSYTTCGTAPRLRSGGPDDLDGTFRAPDEPGTCRLWTILRDDRGGVDWAARVIEVE